MLTQTRNPNVAEYGDPRVKANPSVKTIIAEAKPCNPAGVYGPMKLAHKSIGWECAGSMARLNEREVWGVIFMSTSGAGGGQWFRTEAEARERFKLWAEVE